MKIRSWTKTTCCCEGGFRWILQQHVSSFSHRAISKAFWVSLSLKQYLGPTISWYSRTANNTERFIFPHRKEKKFTYRLQGERIRDEPYEGRINCKGSWGNRYSLTLRARRIINKEKQIIRKFFICLFPAMKDLDLLTDTSSECYSTRIFLHVCSCGVTNFS